MIHFGFLLCSASLAAAGGIGGHIVGHGAVEAPEAHSGYEFGIDNTACQTLYDTHQETTCHVEHSHQVSQQVHHSSGVVGHNTHVVPGGHGHHGKREADASLGGVHGHSSGPQCHANTERQCHQRPVQHARQVP